MKQQKIKDTTFTYLKKNMSSLFTSQLSHINVHALSFCLITFTEFEINIFVMDAKHFLK
jgi:hypothetical protein